MMLENLHFGLNYSLAELSETHDFKIGFEYFVFLVSVGAASGETSFGVMCGGSWPNKRLEIRRIILSSGNSSPPK